MDKYDVTVIGAAIIDVLAGPVDLEAFSGNSQPVKNIRTSFGGDALNESVILSRMGKNVQLISVVGQDDAGKRVLDYMRDNGIRPDSIQAEPGLATSVNIVLFGDDGERHFLTDPQGSLRKLSYECVDRYIDKSADIVSFASMFVSPLFTIEKMERLFKKIKGQGKKLFADMTSPKCGETIDDIRCLLKFVDVCVPNESEITALTGISDPYKNIEIMLEAGVGTAVIKLGARGCLVGDASGIYPVAAVKGINCVDTTGAGDTFAAGFLCGISNGWDVISCARLGCAAASCCVETVGAAEGTDSLGKILRRYRGMG